ncbi:MAG TPA: hypothetical protein VN025_12445 [Candidatus Dormibacteraeota bacterium]|nr:hypothetical protein [Candidatus Dormibacteraeota bacterium]
MTKHMRRLTAKALLFLFFFGAVKGNSQQVARHNWQPATYRGLLVGKSSIDDVRRVLGKPKQLTRGEASRAPILIYSVVDPISGRLEVLVEDGKLKMLMLYPKDPLTQKEVIRLFGETFQITRYSFDECLNQGGNLPVYEDPDGQIEEMEYRQLGIAISLYEGVPQEIQYLGGPLGPTRSRCAKHSKGTRGQTGRFLIFSPGMARLAGGALEIQEPPGWPTLCAFVLCKGWGTLRPDFPSPFELTIESI